MMRASFRRQCAALCTALLMGPIAPGQVQTGQPPPQQDLSSLARFEVTSSLVVLNVAVRDRTGKPVEGLNREDFTVLEDGKPQAVGVFEFQRLEGRALPPLPPPPPPSEKTGEPPAGDEAEEAEEIHEAEPGEVRYKDRRLLVLFFDFASMRPVEQIRAQQAALKFLDQHMTSADLVSVMTFSSDLKLVEDFTDDRERLREIIDGFRMGDLTDPASEDAEVTEEEEEGLEDESTILYTADEGELNIFNTDRKLSALESATRHLAALPEKKALVYFSSGVGKTGVENQSQLNATIHSARGANVAFYPVDARGLVAMPPAGDATQAALRGSDVFSGKKQRVQRDKQIDQQETLYSLAADTGGKAFLDSNDLTLGIVQAQKDIESYYILGYYSTNPAADGRFRRIQVRVASQPRAKLEYRSGYFAARQWKQFDESDRERQLEEALRLGNPPTDLSLALELNYFRLSRSLYFLPLAVKIPGSQIPVLSKGKGEETKLDFLAEIRDEKAKLVSSVRDGVTVKFTGENAGQLSRRYLEYDTGFTLGPGRYRIRFLARENQEGKMGVFETDFEVPDLDADPAALRLSSVVWSNQRQALTAVVGNAEVNKKLIGIHPLVQDGRKLIPSITRVFRRSQNLYVYFEVYDPATAGESKSASLAATISFFHGKSKAFESKAVRLTQAAGARAQSVPFQFQLPLASLKPGTYTCQVNVVDELGRKFAYSRAPLVLLP